MKLIQAILLLGCLLGSAPGVQAQQVCNNSIAASTPSADFTDNGHGTVTHKRTGLMWQRCALGQTWTGAACTGNPSVLSWSGALQAAVEARDGGFSDWRLPNIKELLSIVEEKCVSPAINTSIFPDGVASNFWSASANAYPSDRAWSVYFGYGYADSYRKGNAFQVRLVRAGQSFSSFDFSNQVASLSYSWPLASGWTLLCNSLNQPLPVTPTFADATKITSVWKWDAAKSGWQFFTPAMDAATLQAYAAGKGYAVLGSINPGEGFWVNVKLAGGLVNQSGAAFALTAAALQPGWNLVATSNDVSPSDFNLSLSVTPPAAGTVPQNLISLWAWDNPQSKWYFYSPVLEASAGLGTYTAGKGYLDFAASGKTLGNGVGFWVNKP